MTSFLSILIGHAARQPDEPAIITDAATIRYADLAERVSAMATWLIANGIEPGVTCGITIEDPADHLITAMALLCVGVPQVGLASHETEVNVAGIAGRVGVRQVVADRDRPWMEGRRVLHPPFGHLPPADSGASIDIPFPEGVPPLYHSTSGSTSVSRSVEFPMARLHLLAERLAESPRDRRALRGRGIEFDATRVQRIGSLLAGNTCVFGRIDRPAELAALCSRAGVTVIQLGAYGLTGLAWSPDAVRLPSFTHISVGGQRVPGSLRRRVIERLTPNLWVQYATTEVGEISRARPEEHADFPEGVGMPGPKTTVEIVDEHDRPVAPGEIGNIRVRKDRVGVTPVSYVADPAASRAFRDGFFYPGDLGSWRPGEPIIHHGRADDVMIMNGINIRPAAIEDRLSAHPDVRDAVAFPIRSRIHGEIPAVAVVRAGGDTSPAAFLAFCREALGIRSPREVFIVDAIPRSAVGKPLRQALSERFSPVRPAR